MKSSWIQRAGASLLFGAVAAGTLFPAARTWGVHFLAYYGWPMIAAVMGAAAAVLLWPRLMAAGTAGRIASQMRRIPDWMLVVGGGLLFTALRAATPLLGDGQVWINEIASGTSDYLRNRAPLTLFSLHQLYALLHPLTGIAAERLIAISSIVGGMFVLAAWLRLSRMLGTARGDVLLTGFAWGGIELCCGYVETYVPMTAAVTWMLVLMLASIHRARVNHAVLPLGLLSIAFNWAAVVFLPALAAYYWIFTRRASPRPKLIFVASGALLAAAAILYFVLGWARGTDVLLPLIPAAGWTGAHVLSPRHAADLINVLLLAAGPLGLLLFLYIEDRNSTGRSWDSASLLMFTVLAFPLAALIMHNPQLGMARDWDIAAALLAGVPVFSIMLLSRLSKGQRAVRATFAAWIILVTIPWLGVQASPVRSMNRFRGLLRLDPQQSESGWDFLASYSYQRGMFDQWAASNREALQRSENPRYHANLALYHAMRQQWDDARRHATSARAIVMADSALSEWERNVTSPARLLALGVQYNKQRNPDAAGQTWIVANMLAPGNVQMNRE